MTTRFNIDRLLVAVLGVVGFGLLMALRDAVSGLPLRSVLAGLAFAWGAAALIWLVKPRP